MRPDVQAALFHTLDLAEVDELRRFVFNCLLNVLLEADLPDAEIDENPSLKVTICHV